MHSLLGYQSTGAMAGRKKLSPEAALPASLEDDERTPATLNAGAAS
ncbi:hypothetical protein [Rhizobium rosettiformans]|nr:hypothetical protein [Rhizobium rosettiformans]MDR7029419.1 hypothetical protein [Rhizobium rosettiformans]MDR7063133.1 hypothetical protein [Rhizobium rosettiformans]